MAKHFETGECLPEEMYQQLLKQRGFGTGMAMMRQLQFSQLDMDLHDNYNPSEKKAGESVWTHQKQTALRFSSHNPPLEEDKFLCSFCHIFGGYAAGYYSYKWAEVMSADAFAAFEEIGLDGECKDSELRTLGLLFRDTVLGLGGSKDPMEVYVQFRGKEPSTEALLRHNNMIGQ